MRLWAAGSVALVSAALLVPVAGSQVRVSSGDTCTASGTGTSYTLVITLPSNAPEQGAFAFGASGVTVKGIKDTGSPGSLSTQNLPASTTSAWVLTSPPSVPPGASLTPTLTTSGSVTGSFTVVPATTSKSAASSTYLDPISCAVVKGAPVPSSSFTVQSGLTRNAAAGLWYLHVVVPGRGKVFVGSKGTQKPLLRSRTVSVSGAGRVRLPLEPTAAGKTVLAASGSLKLRLIVEFSPKNGKTTTKTLLVTLKK